jgi:hypothetical protein
MTFAMAAGSLLPSGSQRRPPFGRVFLSTRDREILTLALRKLRGPRATFGDALRALREAVEERIPAGRTYLLGSDANGPVVGSIVSGVGIVESAGGVLVVRIAPDGQRTVLGRMGP